MHSELHKQSSISIVGYYNKLRWYDNLHIVAQFVKVKERYGMRPEK